MIKTILNIIKIWGLIFFTTLQTKPISGIENHYAGARSLALSHASVSFSDTWASFHNQAGLALLTDFSAGFFFESKFGVEELSLAAGSVVLPAGGGAFGISFFQFGKSVFKENKLGFAYARQLAERWSAGIQLDYFAQTYPENERVSGFATFEGGLLFQASENLFLGAHLFNPVSGGIEMPGGKQKMPVVFRAGGHYRFDETVLITFETEKDNQNPLLFKSGIEFNPAENRLNILPDWATEPVWLHLISASDTMEIWVLHPLFQFKFIFSEKRASLYNPNLFFHSFFTGKNANA